MPGEGPPLPLPSLGKVGVTPLSPSSRSFGLRRGCGRWPLCDSPFLTSVSGDLSVADPWLTPPVPWSFLGWGIYDIVPSIDCACVSCGQAPEGCLSSESDRASPRAHGEALRGRQGVPAWRSPTHPVTGQNVEVWLARHSTSRWTFVGPAESSELQIHCPWLWGHTGSPGPLS